MGDVAGQEPVHRTVAAKLGCLIVTVDQRLAPETRFPGAVGESAGGGLAALLALLVRDRGGRALAFQHLIYLMIDDRTCVAVDPYPHVGEFIWTPHNNA